MCYPDAFLLLEFCSLCSKTVLILVPLLSSWFVGCGRKLCSFSTFCFYAVGICSLSGVTKSVLNHTKDCVQLAENLERRGVWVDNHWSIIFDHSLQRTSTTKAQNVHNFRPQPIDHELINKTNKWRMNTAFDHKLQITSTQTSPE